MATYCNYCYDNFIFQRIVYPFLDARPLKNAQFRSSSSLPVHCTQTGKAKILIRGIHNVFRGLKFEPNAEIEQKGTLCKSLDASDNLFGR
jgi:hypothetical protein